MVGALKAIKSKNTSKITSKVILTAQTSLKVVSDASNATLVFPAAQEAFKASSTAVALVSTNEKKREKRISSSAQLSKAARKKNLISNYDLYCRLFELKHLFCWIFVLFCLNTLDNITFKLKEHIFFNLVQCDKFFVYVDKSIV